jgi:hypothetical protein
MISKIMLLSYPAHYKDEFGIEETVIFDDGDVIRMTLRGFEFSGDFYSLSISSKSYDKARNLFTFFEDEICGYAIDFQIPVGVVTNNDELQALLHAHVEYGKPVDVRDRNLFRERNGVTTKINQRIDRRSLRLEIEHQGKTYRSDGQSGDFETQLNQLNTQFPPSVYLKICLNCGLSDYPPSIASGLRCFRNVKGEFRQTKDKWEFLKLWDEKGLIIRETYLCPEFEERKPHGE